VNAPRFARIVIVEDEALVAMLIEDSLEAAGHQVLGTADTIAGAVTLVDQARPDLVLCDITLLNGDSGLDVAAVMAERDIPCLFVSGNSPPVEQVRGIAIGCMLKPFRPAKLEEAVQAALDITQGRQPDIVPTGMILY